MCEVAEGWPLANFQQAGEKGLAAAGFRGPCPKALILDTAEGSRQMPWGSFPARLRAGMLWLNQCQDTVEVRMSQI